MPTLSEQYDSFIESLEEKGVPNPRLVVPLAVLALIVVFALFAFPNLLKSETEVSLLVQNPEGKPIAGAEVRLIAGEASVGTKVTDSSGVVSFKAPAGKSLQVSVSHGQYQDFRKRIDYEEKTITLQPLAPPPIEVKLQVVDDADNNVDSALVVLTFDDGNSRNTASDEFGEAVFKSVPSTTVHATVEITKEGYEKKRKSLTRDDIEGRTVIALKKIEKERPVENKVNVLVRVKDEDGNSVEGARVTISDGSTSTPLKTATTDDYGQSRFEGVPAGKKITVSVTDPNERYAAYSSPFEYEASSEAIPVTLSKIVRESRLTIRVKDTSGNPVSEADVQIYDRTKKTFLTSITTNEEGKASLPVEEKSLYVTVYKEGFLPATLFAQAKDDKTVTLQNAEGKTVSVEVTAKRAGEVVPSATVQLFSSEGFPLGLPSAQTGADGTVIFDVPSNAPSFYASASIDFAEGRSDVVPPKEGLQLAIELKSPKARYTVIVKDVLSKKPVKEARVSFVQQQEKLSCTTSAGGECAVDVPSELEFNVVISHAAYLQFTSSVVFLPSGTKREKMGVSLYPRDLTNKASASFQGFFDANGKVLREVENAQRFNAKFLVTVPKSEFARFTVFSGTKASVEEESMAISAFEGPKTFSTGTASAEACAPANANSSELAHWVTFDFPKGFSGSQEVQVEFKVKENAKAGEELSALFQLFGTTQNVPFLVPQDEEKLKALLALNAVSPGDFCGAKTRVEKIKVSRDALSCEEGFCTKFVFAQDSLRSKTSLETELGKEFSLEMEALNARGKISEVSVSASPAIELISLEPKTANTTLLASDSLSLPLDVQQEKKASVVLKAKAIRSTNLAELKITWQTDAGEKEFTRNVVIKGTNQFNVDASPRDLEAALKQKVRVTVKDKLGKPVNDASVALYECEGSPLNGQEFEATDEAQNGVYAFSVEPSSIGVIGVRAKHEQFKTFESCSITVSATDFLNAQPMEITLKGDTRKETVKESVTLESTIAAKVKVTSSIVCGEKKPAPFIVSPKALTLKEGSATFTVESKKTTSKTKCEIVFFGEINKDNKAEARVLVNADLTGPPAPEQLCPQNAKCLSTTEGTSLKCTKTNFLCEDETLSCFACNLGPHTLPSGIFMSVSNYQPDDTQTFAVALEEEPAECRVEGFRNNPTYSPLAYANPSAYGGGIANPLYGTDGLPSNYWSYRPNAYRPELQQYDSELISKLSPYCQQFFQGTYNYNYYGNYYGSYRDPWSTSLNPTYPNYYAPTYPAYTRPAVSVSAQCSRTELVVSAQYTGGDTYYGGGLGGTQQGFLLIRSGGQTRKIPVTVNVVNPYSPTISQPPGYIPQECLRELEEAKKKKEKEKEAGLGDEGIPDSVTVYFNKHTGKGVYERKLDAPSGSSSPSTTTTTTAHHAGEKTLEFASKSLKCTGGAGGTFKVSCSGTTLRVEANCPMKEGKPDCKDGTFKATWEFGKIEKTTKERTVSMVEDTFVPSIIQLLVPEKSEDKGEFPVSAPTEADFTKAKCTAKNAKVSCSKESITASATASGKGHLEIRDMGDYQLREIPVHSSLLSPKELVFELSSETPEKELTATFQPKLTVTPDCVLGPEISALDKKECNEEKTTLRAVLSSFPDNKVGLVAFQFKDNVRKAEEQYPRLSVRVNVKAVAEIDLRCSENWVKGQQGQIFYTFPNGDDASKRKITVTKPDNAVIEPVASKDLNQSGDIRFTPDQEGAYSIKAVTELAKKSKEKTIQCTAAKEGPQGPTPSSTPSGPGAPTPPSPAPTPGGPQPPQVQAPVQPNRLEVEVFPNQNGQIVITAYYEDPERKGPQIASLNRMKLFAGQHQVTVIPGVTLNSPQNTDAGNSFNIKLHTTITNIPTQAQPTDKLKVVIFRQGSESSGIFTSIEDTQTLANRGIKSRSQSPAVLSGRCKGNRPGGGGTEVTCWLSASKAEYRCTDWLNNGFGLCVLSVDPSLSRVGVSVSGGNGICGGFGQTNFLDRYAPYYKNCGGWWSFSINGAHQEQGVGPVVDVTVKQGDKGPPFSSPRDENPLQSPHCTFGTNKDTVTCKLKPGVTHQRCTETTAKGAVVCANSIDYKQKLVQLKTTTPYGTCSLTDDGRLYAAFKVPFFMAKGMQVSCNRDTKFDVSVDEIEDGYVQVTLKDR